MTALKDIPEAELVALSKNVGVKNYMIGFDEGNRCVIWKVRFEDGREVVFYFAPAVAIHFTKGIRRDTRRHRWQGGTWPDETPEITQADWQAVIGADNMVTEYRAEAYSDTVILALKVGKDLFQVLRLSPEQAVQIAELHWERIQNGTLRDIAGELPPTNSRN